jgi:hypothetical protein
MIVLSVGLPKSGSAWYYYMTNDLLVAAGHEDAGAVKERYNLQNILKFPTCNIQEPTEAKLEMLLQPPVRQETFAVKTHFPPNEAVIKALQEGMIKVTFLYRDPRDIALSGYDAGAAMRRRGKTGTFANIHTMEEAILWAEKWLKKTWNPWRQVDGILKVKYEDLLLGPFEELARLNRFLELDVADETLRHIVSHWDKHSQTRSNAPKGHLNKGIHGRHRKAMGDAELELCRRHLGPYIEEMGY